MRILLVDDQRLFLDGLRSLLLNGGYEVVGEASDGLQALVQARALHPDVILMDIRMPHLDGIQATRLIKTELPEIQIVVLTTSLEDADLFEALKSGAGGYLLKNLQPEELFDYLAGLSRGEAPLSRQLSARLLREFARQAGELERQAGEADRYADPAASLTLTTRQREILNLAAQGLTYREIGTALDVSEHTVKYHMGEILQRLHMKNREQVVAYALRTGLVSYKPPQDS